MLQFLVGFAIGQNQDIIVDDREINAALNTYGETIASNSNLHNNKTLQAQLTRKQAKVQLPTARPIVNKNTDFYTTVRKATVVFSSFGLCGNCAKFHPNPASGFIVSPDGLVVTNYHVIENPDASAFAVMTADKKLYKVTEVLAADKRADVALVKVDGNNLPYLPIRKSINLGENVFVLSHPRSHFFSLTKGAATRYMKQGNTPWLEISADYAAGSSGAPVMDETGQVVGVVSMTNSIYYNESQQKDLQMVRKICVPSQAILNLVE